MRTSRFSATVSRSLGIAFAAFLLGALQLNALSPGMSPSNGSGLTNQIFTIHFPPPDCPYNQPNVPCAAQWGQIWLRIVAGGNWNVDPYRDHHTCTIISGPAENVFYLETDGSASGPRPIPWTTTSIDGRSDGGVDGGTNGLIQNSQCVVSGNASNVHRNADRSADMTVSLSFKPSQLNQTLWIWLIGADGAGWYGWYYKGTWSLIQDSTSPAITNVAPSPGATSAAVVWQTNEPSDSTVLYGPTAAYGNASSLSVPETQHAMALNNLSPATLYYYQITSRDLAGNQSGIVTGTFQTAASSSVVGGTVNIIATAAVDYPLDPGPCAVVVDSTAPIPGSNLVLYTYHTKYITLATTPKATRTENNTIRLRAESSVAMSNEAVGARLDYRSYWSPVVVSKHTINSAVAFGPSTDGITQNLQGTALAFRYVDYNVNTSLPISNLGQYSVAAHGGAKSTYCSTYYPAWWGAVGTVALGAGSDYLDSQTVQRPARPDYDISSGPVYWLGDNVNFTGSYTRNAVLRQGDPKGATGNPTWKFVAGGTSPQFATLSCGGVAMSSTTPCSTPLLTARRRATGCLQYDVVLKTVYGGLESEPFYVFINTPHNTLAVADPDGNVWNYTFPWEDGWQSRINYSTQDLCGNILSGYEINERFTHPDTGDPTNAWKEDYADNNWAHPNSVGGFVPMQLWTDYMGVKDCSSCVPPVSNPGPDFIKVQHTWQTFRVGSQSSGVGKSIQANRHQRYTDQGEHEAIVSPSEP